MSAAKLLQSTIGLCIYGFYSQGYYHLWEQMLWKHKLLLYGTWTKWFSSIIISQIVLVSQVFIQHLWGIKYCMEWGDSKNKDSHAQGMCTYSIILQLGLSVFGLWHLQWVMESIPLDNEDSSIQKALHWISRSQPYNVFEKSESKNILGIVVHPLLISLLADVRGVCYSHELSSTILVSFC